MAQFTSNFQNFKPSYPFLQIDPNLELVNPFQGMSHSFLENPNMNFQSFMPFPNDSIFSTQTHNFPGNLTEDFSGIVNDNISIQQIAPFTQPPIPVGNIEFNESKKRKAMTLSESTSENCSPQVSESGIDRKNSSRKGKRVKSNEKEEEKSKEVVHVRARRGQATDSHSLAERVRRGKINERLKCLQDIVPGCYKTMGMAVMLDEIISYVQSLQNQVEFLSMKLTAASSYYDFNSETDVPETMESAKANEAKGMETLMREGYGGFACFHSNWSL